MAGGKLSANLEGYLEIISDLSDEHGHAHVKDVALALNVKAPSVTNALQSLLKKGLVNYKAYSPITLTPKGQKKIEELSSKHGVLREFLKETLAMKPFIADKYACKLEHVIDGKVTNRVEKMTQFIRENRELSDKFLKPLKKYLNK